MIGKVVSLLRTEDNCSMQDVYIIEGAGKPLLGNTCIENIAKVNLVDKSDPKSYYAKEFPALYTGLGEVDGEYSIKIKPDAEPYVLNTPCRIPLPQMDKVKKELEQMQKLNVIKPVGEATEWCSPMVIVPKPNGDLKICTDLTKLNNSVVRERFMLPTVEHSLGQLAGSTIFTKLDANSGYW